MTYITLEELLAEVETIFANYSESNDLDRISIKGWVIDKLRSFGKNICDQREMVVGIENSRALLPENFKSLVLALKIEGEIEQGESGYREVPFKTYITNDVQWDAISQTYIKNNCQSQLIVENLIVHNHPIEQYMHVAPLSLTKGIQKNTLDTNCYNLHPSIRNAYPHEINITNRTINTNFKKGLIYLQYNSLPSDEEGEIVIPIITTGDIYKFILLDVKIHIVESLLINNKNAESLKYLLQLWMSQYRQFYIEAKSEANFHGLSENWHLKAYNKNRENQNRYNLPRF